MTRSNEHYDDSTFVHRPDPRARFWHSVTIVSSNTFKFAILVEIDLTCRHSIRYAQRPEHN